MVCTEEDRGVCVGLLVRRVWSLYVFSRVRVTKGNSAKGYANLTKRLSTVNPKGERPLPTEVVIVITNSQHQGMGELPLVPNMTTVVHGEHSRWEKPKKVVRSMPVKR
jgi:hypothetical protein